MKIGIDLGSRNVKIVLIDDNNELRFHKFDSVKFYREFSKSVDDKVHIDIEKLKSIFDIDHVDEIISTGYGRNLIKFENSKAITELKAHYLGAKYQTKLENFTLLDLGGQDSKIICVRHGKMVDFETNDKCAASSGRYLENIAKLLDYTIEELAEHHEDPIPLNNTCAIFSESEIISHIVRSTDFTKIAAGANFSVVNRIIPELRRFSNETLVFTGGIAKNNAVIEILKKEAGFNEVIVPEHPQFNGAIGCVI